MFSKFQVLKKCWSKIFLTFCQTVFKICRRGFSYNKLHYRELWTNIVLHQFRSQFALINKINKSYYAYFLVTYQLQDHHRFKRPMSGLFTTRSVPKSERSGKWTAAKFWIFGLRLSKIDHTMGKMFKMSLKLCQTWKT